MEKASKRNNYHYNKNLKNLATQLRKNMTKAEASLWKYTIGSKGMKGYVFRRQRPVLEYIADFMCIELMLIIEVDGISHDFNETITKDIKREEDLETIGFTVLRFTDNEVLNQINDVTTTIENWIQQKEEELIKEEQEI